MPPHRSVSRNGSKTAGLFSDAFGATDLDAWARTRGYSVITGVDEVGRGPLAGPVVAAAVVLPKDHRIAGLADSKQLTPAQRKRLSEEIRSHAAAYGLGQVEPARIDCINILKASLEAMSIAFAQVLARGLLPDIVLVDGTFCFPMPAGAPPILQKPFVKADVRSPSVSAASIVAKVYRDELMDGYHERFPQYGFDQHKGYATAMHKRALAEHGPCEIHRRSFAGVCEPTDSLKLFQNG
jgi:ribonuclease HII